jgi:hypothetical protein
VKVNIEAATKPLGHKVFRDKLIPIGFRPIKNAQIYLVLFSDPVQNRIAAPFQMGSFSNLGSM